MQSSGGMFGSTGSGFTFGASSAAASTGGPTSGKIWQIFSYTCKFYL